MFRSSTDAASGGKRSIQKVLADTAVSLHRRRREWTLPWIVHCPHTTDSERSNQYGNLWDCFVLSPI